jgi:sporulation protein YunB
MRLRVKFSKKWIIVLVLIVLVAGYLILDSVIRPTILSLSEARLRAIGVKAMNDAVRETIGASKVTYSDLIHIEKDDTGKISLITANTVLMNNMAAQTAMAAQDKILNAGEQGVNIPIGTILGGPLLTGRGPAVVIKFEPVGSVTTDIKAEFEDAGINQTRHKIYLVLDATVRILVGNAAQTVEISSKVLISDTIIVGEVPQGYYKGAQSDLLNLLPGAELQ